MNFFLIFQPFGLCVSQADINGLWSRWDQWFCFMCANPTGGSGFPLVGIGGFLTRELYWQRRNSPSRLQKQKGRAGGRDPRWKKQDRHEQWQWIFKWKTSRQNQNAAATDDLDRGEYEKLTDTWLVQEMHATGCLTGHKAKSPQVDTYK